MTPDHIYWHKNERKYANVDPKLLPITESAEDCHNRVFSLWQQEISRDLREGRNVMVSEPTIVPLQSLSFDANLQYSLALIITANRTTLTYHTVCLFFHALPRSLHMRTAYVVL